MNTHHLSTVAQDLAAIYAAAVADGQTKLARQSLLILEAIDATIWKRGLRALKVETAE